MLRQKMRTLLFTIILVTLSTATFCQNTSDSLFTLTTEQNFAWLTALKNSAKGQQLRLINNRFFRQPTFRKPDNDNKPLLIVDGIPIRENSDSKTRDFFLNDLTADKVDIKVLDKEPEGLYIHKRFTGIILMTISDRRTSKRFKRLG